jgi:ribonuclease HI
MPAFRHPPGVTDRPEVHTDGIFNDQTGVGGWAAVIARSTSGRQEGTSSYEMELCALVEAEKLADGPCTIVSDHEGIVGIALALRGMTPRICKPLWEDLYAATAGKDGEFAWRKRDQSLGSRLAHQLAREAARGR